jgi:hypothetical protein
MKLIWAGLGLALASVPLSLMPARALNIQIIADNDFALFSGTSSSVNTILFQNNVDWYNQLSLHSGPLPAVPPGDTHFYLLAMGGGPPEEVLGTIDGKSLAAMPDVLVSNDLSTALSGFDLLAVVDGTFSVALADVQAALPTLTFQPASLGCDYVCTNYGSFVNHQAFVVAGNGAQLFAFKVPGPLPFAGLLGGFHFARKIRQRIQARRL